MMEWRFWRPRHSVASVAANLARGLTEGTIALDEPFADDDQDHRANNAGLILELDVAENVPDTELLEIVKRLTVSADDEHRQHGGHGLAIRQVKIASALEDDVILKCKGVRVAFQVKTMSDPKQTLENVAANLRSQASIPNVRLLSVRTLS